MEPHTRLEKYLDAIVYNTSGAAPGGPLILDADKAEEYNTIPAYGDKALKAIQEGRPILVRVPNADGGNYTAIYSPVYMYQLPNFENNYLYLFYLRDEKQDLSPLLGQAEGTVQMPTYGELKMLLSQEYNGSPLGQPYIGQNRPTGSAAGTKPVFLISSGGDALVYYDNPERKVTAQELVDMYFAGNGYVANKGNIYRSLRINSVFYMSGVRIVFISETGTEEIRTQSITEAEFNAAMAKYLP